jgi:hypothetical protein
MEAREVFQFRNAEDVSAVDAPGGGRRIDYDFARAKVRRLQYPAGAQVPRHGHNEETLHLILSGKIENTENGQMLAAGADYKCGGIQYGPWTVVEDLDMVVIEV